MAKNPTSKPGMTRRQRSRAEREARMQRTVVIITVTVATIVVGLIAYALINEYVIQPNRPVVRVNGDQVSATEFKDHVLYDYANFYVQMGGQPLEQFGLTANSLGQITINSLVNDLLVEQKAEELGISVSEAEVDEQLQLAFGYDAGEPEPTATPRPPTSVPGTPTATATFVFTPTPTPTPTLEPGVTPTPTLAPTATPSEPLTPTPTFTPAPTTEVTEQDFEALLTQNTDLISQVSGLSPERVREFLRDRIRANLLQDRVMEALDIQVDDTKVMVHAAHILVDTEEEAQAALARIEAGESFEEVAADVSTDTTTAYRGGDLGWFGPGAMVEPFDNAAFALEPGEISEPIQTDFGWHLIKVYDRKVVPLTDAELAQARSDAFSEMVSQWRNEGDVVIEDRWESVMPELPSASATTP
jgi:parvulin-like peptidyl-prolyl isomerase